MRTAAAILLLSFIAVPQASAQTPCTQEDPCLVAIDVDETSLAIAGGESYTVTAGDWFTFDVFNLDGGDHELGIADLEISFTAAGFDGTGPDSAHGPFEMDVPGSFVLQDYTTGEEVTLVVVEEDVAGDPRADNESPGIGVALFAVALAGLLFVRRP